MSQPRTDAQSSCASAVIRYSVFWGAGDLDAAAVTIAGTTRELWTTYVPTFDAMSAIQLIDMSRFDSGAIPPMGS